MRSSLAQKIVDWQRKPIEQQILPFKYRYYWIENLLYEKFHALDFHGHIPREGLSLSFRPYQIW